MRPQEGARVPNCCELLPTVPAGNLYPLSGVFVSTQKVLRIKGTKQEVVLAYHTKVTRSRFKCLGILCSHWAC